MHEGADGRAAAQFSPAEAANFLAAKTVAHAAAFLDGRNNETELARNARSMQLSLLAAGDDIRAKPILDASRLLLVAMMGAAWAKGDERLARWQQVMGALVELVQHESLALRTESWSNGAPARQNPEQAENG